MHQIPTTAGHDAGDKYVGLDRFGRVADQRWTNTATTFDEFQYGYDADGNALYRNNLVNASFGELYHASGSAGGYDGLNQIEGFLRGVLNASDDTISAPSASETYATDAAGNFTNANYGTSGAEATTCGVEYGKVNT